MNVEDFVRLGLLQRLPERPQLPESIRLALEQTSLLPLDLVTWVATAESGPLLTQLRQALAVHAESPDPSQSEQAMQLARLIKKRLDQLGVQL